MSRSGRKRKGGEGHGDDERWLITYADMITLLMAFFIMMYAMSITNLGKFSKLAVSVRTGFGGDASSLPGTTFGISSSGSPLPGVLPASSFELMTKIAGAIRQAVTHDEYENLEFLSEHGVVTIRMKADDVLFARGSAQINARSRRTLDVIAKTIANLPCQIRVEGHTCDLPIRTARFPSNWELSTQRATNVVLRFVRRHGFSPKRLSAAGYADTAPVAPNTSEANRARNRRIDMVLLRQSGATAHSAIARNSSGPPDSVADSAADIQPERINIAPNLSGADAQTGQRGGRAASASAPSTEGSSDAQPEPAGVAADLSETDAHDDRMGDQPQ